MLKSLFLNSFKLSTRAMLLIAFIILGSIIFYKNYNIVPKDKVLKIAIINNNPPFNIKTKDKNLKGFDIDLIKNFFNDLEIPFEVVILEQDEMVPSVKEGLYDIGIISENELSKENNKESLDEILISKPYIESKNIIIKKYNDDKLLKYKNVGVLTSDNFIDNYEDKLNKSQILEYKNFNDMYKAFNGGDVEALILNDLALKHATLKNKIKNYFLDTNLLNGKNEYVFIFPKDSRYFYKVSRKLANFRKQNKFKLIYQKWFGDM